MFQSLTEEHLREIVNLQLKDVHKRLEDLGRAQAWKSQIKPKKRSWKRGYDPQYGARPLRRAIQRLIEDPFI